MASSINDSKSGERIYNIKDAFAVGYNIKYKTAIYKKGKVGNYAFYWDAYILDDSIATYCDDTELVLKLDRNKIKTDGINSYLGYIIRSVIEHKEEIKANLINKPKSETTHVNNTKEDKSRLLSTPGAVRYEDVQEYLRNKNRI
jgi:hypothetical protein